jgi:yecA family protein
MKNKLTKHDEKVLASFLSRHRKDNTMSLLETKGFLFCLVCCPEPVAPSEWIPVILEDAGFNDDQEAQQVMDSLLVLYNQMNSQILHGTAKLPKECRVLPDIMSNFTEPAPIHQWSVGFMKSYSWLSESWEELFDALSENGGEDEGKGVISTLGFNFMILGIASDRQAFENTFDEKTTEERQAMVKEMLALLPQAVKSFAEMALLVRNSGLFNPAGGASDH